MTYMSFGLAALVILAAGIAIGAWLNEPKWPEEVDPS